MQINVTNNTASPITYVSLSLTIGAGATVAISDDILNAFIVHPEVYTDIVANNIYLSDTITPFHGDAAIQFLVKVAKLYTIGATSETAPVSDIASSGLNGRLQRIAQRLTSLIALLPTSLGQKTMANSLAIVVASDQSNIPVSQATASSLNAQVVGNVASAAADSGNPVKVGGIFNTTLPTVTNGQRVDQQMSNRGELLTREKNSHQRLTGAATTVIKSGAGSLRRVVISGPANSTITLYDNTAGSGTIIAVITAVNGTSPSFLEFGIDFTTGLTAVTTGASSNYNILYS